MGSDKATASALAAMAEGPWYIRYCSTVTIPWWTYKPPSRELTEDDKALHRAIHAVRRERGE